MVNIILYLFGDDYMTRHEELLKQKKIFDKALNNMTNKYNLEIAKEVQNAFYEVLNNASLWEKVISAQEGMIKNLTNK